MYNNELVQILEDLIVNVVPSDTTVLSLLGSHLFKQHQLSTLFPLTDDFKMSALPFADTHHVFQTTNRYSQRL